MARVSKPHFNPSSPDYHALHTVEDVTERNVQTILELEEAAKANRSDPDPTLQVLDQATHPEKLVDQIERLRKVRQIVGPRLKP
jgi:hypothetical protein